ncbi:DUF3285 domain-containing protein [Pseudanabaena sp. FACHB-1998]|uniref:DUF3285 domain-containing protein n=1 Tax=Pseudanabaena sp. FACHB-1998 TaxID=2692858 RepID=UPI0016815710|nr:DUF3285 domain-containing protein [Pseudanabaena sp. FACHB-1998]MBD2176271.1 DUF3285 domain-containing protein [Pseudanabaena sp. FACHB-1998]
MSINTQDQPQKPSSADPSYKAQKDNASQAKAQDGFVKLAMRNMVNKGNTSLFHLGLTVLGVFGTLIGLAIVFH